MQFGALVFSDMIATLHKNYLIYLKVRGIKPDIIYFVHELKVEMKNSNGASLDNLNGSPEGLEALKSSTDYFCHLYMITPAGGTLIYIYQSIGSILRMSRFNFLSCFLFLFFQILHGIQLNSGHVIE